MKRIDLPPFPRGWFAVACSTELVTGEALPRTCFGEELVLFRDQSGQVGALDAYCRHLGAHLGHGGTVRDGCITCPFHGWSWSVDGACVDMPYGGRIPPAAKTRSWSVVEQDGVVLVWNDPEGGEPDWQMPSFGDRTWTDVKSIVRTVRSHPQEILENTVDFAHFRFVHRSHIVRPLAEPKVEGPLFEVAIESDPDAVMASLRLDDGFSVEGSAFCHGPGLAAATIGAKGMNVHALQRLYATPVDGETVELRGLVNVEIDGDPEAAEQYAEVLAPAVFENWDRDIEIWEQKRYQPWPVLNSAEHLIPVFRRWYSGFHPDGTTQSAMG